MANTTYLNIEIPDVAGDNNTWGTIANAAFNSFDACLRPTGNGTSVGLNVGSGNTITVAGAFSGGSATSFAMPATATAGGAVVTTISGTQTLTNKTLTTPVFSGTPTGTVTSGTWTPNFNVVSNVDSFTQVSQHYIRIGSYVFANVRVMVDPSSSGACQFRVSLPVASNIASASDVIGLCASSLQFTDDSPGHVDGDSTNDDAVVYFTAVSTSPVNVNIQFSYVIN